MSIRISGKSVSAEIRFQNIRKKRGNFIGSIVEICLFCLLAAAVWMDVRMGRISNRLIIPGLLTGFIRNLAESGWRGSIYFLIQISVPVLIFFLLFLMHALGAGDIKLFSVIGSCIGLKRLFRVIIISFLAGAAGSLFTLLWNKNLYTRLIYFSNYVRTALHTKSITAYDFKSDGKQNYIHFSIAILIGYCLGGV